MPIKLVSPLLRRMVALCAGAPWDEGDPRPELVLTAQVADWSQSPYNVGSAYGITRVTVPAVPLQYSFGAIQVPRAVCVNMLACEALNESGASRNFSFRVWRKTAAEVVTATTRIVRFNDVAIGNSTDLPRCQTMIAVGSSLALPGVDFYGRPVANNGVLFWSAWDKMLMNGADPDGPLWMGIFCEVVNVGFKFTGHITEWPLPAVGF